MSGALGVQAVLARMATIEARFGTARPPVAAEAADAGAGFDAALVSALGAAQGSTPAALAGTSTGTLPAAAGDYAEVFAREGAEHGVDPALLAAVAQVESGMNPRAVSPAGAQGLMQIMPATARGLGVADPFDPAQAVDGAARLLRSHLDRFGTVELALAAYNAGAGAVSRHGGIPPYEETQNYVRRVMDRYGAAS